MGVSDGIRTSAIAVRWFLSSHNCLLYKKLILLHTSLKKQPLSFVDWLESNRSDSHISLEQKCLVCNSCVCMG